MEREADPRKNPQRGTNHQSNAAAASLPSFLGGAFALVGGFGVGGGIAWGGVPLIRVPSTPACASGSGWRSPGFF